MTDKIDESKSYVICPICGHKGQNVGWHIKTAHGLTKQEFRQLYPNHSLVCEKFKLRISSCAKQQWHEDYYKKKDSIHSAKARKRIKENRKNFAVVEEQRFKRGRGF